MLFEGSRDTYDWSNDAENRIVIIFDSIAIFTEFLVTGGHKILLLKMWKTLTDPKPLNSCVTDG